MASFVHTGYWAVTVIGLILAVGFAVLGWRDWRTYGTSTPIALLYLGMSLAWLSEASSKLYFAVWRGLDQPAGWVDGPFVGVVTWGLAIAGVLHLASWWTRYRAR